VSSIDSPEDTFRTEVSLHQSSWDPCPLTASQSLLVPDRIILLSNTHLMASLEGSDPLTASRDSLPTSSGSDSVVTSELPSPDVAVSVDTDQHTSTVDLDLDQVAIDSLPSASYSGSEVDLLSFVNSPNDVAPLSTDGNVHKPAGYVLPSSIDTRPCVDLVMSVNTPNSSVLGTRDLDKLSTNVLPMAKRRLVVTPVDVLMLVHSPLFAVSARRDVGKTSSGSDPSEVLASEGLGCCLLASVSVAVAASCASLVTLVNRVVGSLMSCPMKLGSTAPVPSRTPSVSADPVMESLSASVVLGNWALGKDLWLLGLWLGFGL